MVVPGPVEGVRRLLERTGLTIGDFDLVEINEAFAAQTLANGRDLGFDWDRVNVNGGAIALGHPIGASGARVATTLLYELRRRGGRYGLADALPRRRRLGGHGLRARLTPVARIGSVALPVYHLGQCTVALPPSVRPVYRPSRYSSVPLPDRLCC